MTHELSNAMAANVPPPFDRWLPLVNAAAKKYRLDPALIFAVMERESGGKNQYGDGNHGRGLMQIDDRTWGAWLAKHDGGMDPASNIMKGAEILRDCLNSFPHDLKAAIAAYNAGSGRVSQAVRAGHDPDSVTTGHNYGADVLRRMKRFEGAGGGPPKPPPSTTTVHLANVIAAAKRDPGLPQGGTTHKADVLPVEKALVADGLLAAKYADGSFGSLTVAAYKAWQGRLGYSGSDADGIPGMTSLTKLGEKHGFRVV